MSKTYRVKILDTAYDKDRDLITWRVNMPDGKTIDLVWPRSDLGPAIGISGDITVELLLPFLEALKGKEKNLVIEGDIKEIADLNDMSSLKQQDEALRKYLTIGADKKDRMMDED